MATLKDLIVDCLSRHPERRMTAREIGEWIAEEYPKKAAEKKAKSSWARNEDQVVQALLSEVSSLRPSIQRQHPEVKITEGRPRHYYWSDKTDEDEVRDIESSSSSGDAPSTSAVPLEKDLYPLLKDYLLQELGIHAMRIEENASANKQGPNGNRWLYPDMVGMEDLTCGWHIEVRDLAKEWGASRAKIFSFEVKRFLNRSNVRQCFFQAVSNSTWANHAYLVAAEIEGVDTLKELRMLSALHGIGVMRLNVENLAESEILIQARERLEVDWATCTRLANENMKFRKFTKDVRHFLITGDPSVINWD